jgi:hypothetical protein
MDRTQNIRNAFNALGVRLQRALHTQRGDVAQIRARKEEVVQLSRDIEAVRYKYS